MSALFLRSLAFFILAGLLLIQSATKSYSQEKCGRPADLFYRSLSVIGIDEPQDETLNREFQKIYQLDEQILQLTKDNASFKVIPINSVNTKTRNGYVIEGLLSFDGGKKYKLQLLLQATCTNKVIAEAVVLFEMYPTWDHIAIAKQAVTKLLSGIDVWKMEEDVRDAKNYGLGGDLMGGHISITMDNKLVKGEETRVEMMVVDCDDKVLNNKEIITEGTKGGIFTPAKFKTNAEGKAFVKFKMTSDKAAIIKAACETKNVWGCEDLYTGTEVIKGIGGDPVKVEITYEQLETKTLKRATIPSVKIKGGDEVEMIGMQHRSVLYHFPAKEALKKGYLVEAVNDNDSGPGPKTEYVIESGWYLYSKNIKNTQLSGMVGNVEVVREEEKGEEKSYSGYASLKHTSQVTFYKGDANNPAQFSWAVEYPVSGDEVAGGGMVIVKGDDGVQWKVKKITDPKSIYKTEYLLLLRLDAAEELKKGAKAMKDAFGMDLDDITKIIDPTKPQANMAGASGYQSITVRILSPYPEN